MSTEVDIRLDRNTHRIRAFVGDRNVGSITVVPVQLDWGHHTLVPMGGIAAVGTSNSHRNLGIASRMMRRANEHALEIGCPVGGVSTGVTNTARRLYSRAGYVHLFNMDRYHKAVTPAQPVPPPPGISLRPFVPGDSSAVLELRDRTYASRGFFGGVPHDPARWLARRTQLLTRDPNAAWVAFRGRNLVGWVEYYIHWSQDENISVLVDPNDPDAPALALTLLSHVERSLHDAGLAHFATDVSSHEPILARALLDYGCRPQPSFVFAVAIHDLPGLLNRLQPLFLKRLRDASLTTWPNLLRVRMGEITAEIPLPEGTRATTLEIAGPYPVIVETLTGRIAAWEHYLRGNLSLSGDPLSEPQRLLDVLLGAAPFVHPRRDRW